MRAALVKGFAETKLADGLALLYNLAMQASRGSDWRAGLRRTRWLALAGLALWAFAIYWQGDVNGERLALAGQALLRLEWWAIPAPIGSLLVDLLLLILGSLFWLAFFANYVLPVRSPGESVRMLGMLLSSLLGRRPAALFVRDGQSHSAQVDARVLLLDSASAAVLRQEAGYTRALGPGLHFVPRGEQVARTLDLHAQRRQLGPLPSEDPFAQDPDEDPISAASRLARRRETSGLTRDGVEVVPRIEVDFRLEGRVGGGGSPFGFHPEFAWRAIANEGVDPRAPSDARGRQVSWDWLPAHAAADVWREYVRKFSLAELFEPRDSAEGDMPRSGLERILEMLNLRLREAIVPELDETGTPVERQLSSPEYKLLRERGLRVLAVRLREVHLEAAREEARLRADWRELWERRARAAQTQSKSRHLEKQLLGKMDAAQEFLRTVSGELYKRLKRTDGRIVRPPDEIETLRLLLRGSQSGAAQTPGLKADVAAELGELAEWLEEEIRHG